MFITRNNSTRPLFSTHDLSHTLRTTMAKMYQEVESIDANRLLNTAPSDSRDYFTAKYRIEPIRLLRDQWYADMRETQVDVRHDPNRWIDDKSRPVNVPGERVEVRVPFEGEAELLYSKADRFSTNPPRAVVERNELVLRYDTPADAPRDVRSLVDHTLAEIEKHIGWQAVMLAAHNDGLPGAAAQAIEQRRARLLAQSRRAMELGIPIKRRDDAPQTYTIPTTRKKVAPMLPQASSAAYKPEPAWAIEQYEQALKIMQDMTLVMERSPDAFKTMDEEALRQHFLVQLNGQFEGKATGETFNMSGKTDILLREGERNVFITECKFWKGPKAFGEAIDQLLGYTTWRDSKTAILVFNRGTDTSTVLAGVDSTAKSHSNFKRAVDWPHESGYRYVFHTNGDTNRELLLTVLVFHVPK